ncbi:Sec1-like snare protein [Fistulina hepatica ATCC 64428]|uniref:Sec1-like snare protein n=1 Tax=Fistulina hepatica ATCC 64428 TaxID=1128425 RepID=A0A0D7A1Q2_9AGAR|nr:Sec1-like snare protein [Fistulina hepatica ATCC 64428]
MTSLITAVRTKFLDSIRSVNPPNKWKVLVVDEHSQKLLGAVLKQFDVLQENVTQIELITNRRSPQAGLEAMYLLMPTTQNIDRIIRDFAGNTPVYSGAHLFFIDGLDEALFQRLYASNAEPFLRRVEDLYLNFWPTEARTFSLETPEMFFNLYSPHLSKNMRLARDRLTEHLRYMARMIANVCITFDKFPYIRYYAPPNHGPLGPLKPDDSTRAPPPPDTSVRWRTNLARGAEARAYEAAEGDHVTKLLAFNVQRLLEEYKKINVDFAKPRVPPRPRATLIIMDRSMDMLAPFVHEFTYHAMAYALLPIRDGNKYTYKFQSSLGAYEDKTAVLTDEDNVWTEIRHMHMRETIDKLMADFNRFLEENAVFNGSGAANLNDMKEMLANLPKYQEQREKFSLHLNMAQECMSIFERDKLPLVGNVEQCCATGLTAEEQTPKTLVEEMVPLLDSRDVMQVVIFIISWHVLIICISNTNKVRVIVLYIQFRNGVPEEDRRRLYQHARLSLGEQDAVNALTYMGVRISRGPSDKDPRKKIKQKSNDDEYDLSRVKPLLKGIIEAIVDKLDSTMFPYVKDTPSSRPPPATLRSQPQATSLRSQKPAWHRAAKPVVDSRQRLLLFVAGGMTYSEVREVYQLSNSLDRDIFIGSTHTLTPSHFVDDLKVLEINGKGSRAAPSGLQESTGSLRSPQEYYDERYYLEEAPPPQPRPAPTSVPLPRSTDNRSNLVPPAGSSPRSPSPHREEKKKKKGFFHF